LDYSALAKIDLKITVSFPTTYECKVGFSSLLQIKTKHRGRFSVEDVLHCALFSTSPKIKKLAAEKCNLPVR
jgi:hypothetical protein